MKLGITLSSIRNEKNQENQKKNVTVYTITLFSTLMHIQRCLFAYV